MLSTVVAIIVGAGGLLTLVQLGLRWRAHGTDQVRELVAEARTTFNDITAHGELDASEFLSGDRQTLEARLHDRRGQLRDRELQARVDHHLLKHLRGVWASAPPEWLAMSQGVMVNTDSPERRAQVRRQVKAAHDGLVEVDSVLARCDQLDYWIVRS